MLTKVTTATTYTTVTPSAPKTIAITNNTGAGSIMYTVPDGRKFVGYIYNTTLNAQTYINNAWAYHFQGGGNTAGSNQQPGANNLYTFYAGTVIKEGGNANTSILIGYEMDI